MIAVSLDNLLFLLLIAVAALFQLLSKAITKAGKSDSNEASSAPTPQSPRPMQRAPRESDADRIRKFLEALGQPPSSTPPQPILPRTDVPPRRLAPVQPPRVIPGTWRLPREHREKPDVRQTENLQSERPSPLQQTVPPPAPPLATPAEAYAAPTRPTAKSTEFKTQIATLIASKSGLREAIVLREIFGPPRGLQALEVIGS
jgi:hypothetical protein